MRKGRRQKLMADEWDWVSKRARRVHRFSAGDGKAIKRRMNRRIRREIIEID